MKWVVEMLEESGLDYNLSLYKPLAEFVLCLRGKSSDPVRLSTCHPHTNHSAADTRYLVGQFADTYGMTLAFLFGDIRRASELSSKLVDAFPGPHLLARWMYQALISFSQTRHVRNRRHYRAGCRSMNKLERYLRKGCVNGHHMLKLCKAFQVSLKEDVSETQKAYDEAISAAGRLGFLHHQALGNELAAMFFYSQDDTQLGADYLARARQLWSDYGADAKVRHLDSCYGTSVSQSSSSLRGRGLKARARFSEIESHDTRKSFLLVGARRSKKVEGQDFYSSNASMRRGDSIKSTHVP